MAVRLRCCAPARSFKLEGQGVDGATQNAWLDWPRARVFIAVLALSACAILPPPVSQRAGTEQAAESAARKGDHVQAATQYENLAATRAPPEQVELQLAAAREWLAAGRAADAARVLAGIGAPQTGAQSLERSLLDAESSLVANRAQEAWQKIGAIPESAATGAAAGAAIRYYSLKMRIALAAARPVDAVRAEIAAEGFAANAAERTQLRSQLLAALRDAREHGVKLEAAASQDPIVRGWLELGAIATDTRGASLIGEAEAASWRAKYPNHPALEVLAQALPAPLVVVAGGRIALLLPLSGAAAGQAATVRDGFLSAYYQLPAATRPALQVYDTGAVSAGRCHRPGALGRQQLHRRAVDARGRGGGRRPGYAIRSGAGAQFPAGRSAGPGRPVPVRAVTGRRGAAGCAPHARRRPSPRHRAGAAR